MRTPIIYHHQKIKSDKLTIKGENAHYLKNVLRVKKDHPVIIKTFDRWLYETIVAEVTISSVILKITTKNKLKARETFPKVNLYLSLVKPATLSSIVQKITELGVSQLYPIVTEYSTMKIGDFNSRRYEKIALNALMQSGRDEPLLIHKPINVYSLEKMAGNFAKSQTMNLLAYENATNEFSKEVSYREVNFFIGPEGGISWKERDFLEELGFASISLSKNILRVETAVLFLLAKVL